MSSGAISNGIRAVTRSPFSHVGLIYSNDFIFETHMRVNARFNPLNKKYVGKHIVVVRPELTEGQKADIKRRCEYYDETRYSMWDIATNFAMSWLPPEKRKSIVQGIGTKSMMICSEITATIYYEGAGFQEFVKSGGLTPSDVFEIQTKIRKDKIVFDGVLTQSA